MSIPDEAVQAAARDAYEATGWVPSDMMWEDVIPAVLTATVPHLRAHIARAMWDHHREAFVLALPGWDALPDEKRKPWLERADAVTSALSPEASR